MPPCLATMPWLSSLKVENNYRVGGLGTACIPPRFSACSCAQARAACPHNISYLHTGEVGWQANHSCWRRSAARFQQSTHRRRICGGSTSATTSSLVPFLTPSCALIITCCAQAHCHLLHMCNNHVQVRVAPHCTGSTVLLHASSAGMRLCVYIGLSVRIEQRCSAWQHLQPGPAAADLPHGEQYAERQSVPHLPRRPAGGANLPTANLSPMLYVSVSARFWHST